MFQVQKSDMNRVTLIDLHFNTTGNYKCEVSTEAPNFQTVAQNSSMTVMGKCAVFHILYVQIFNLTPTGLLHISLS